jgi:phosphoribosylglycinamide formyltransferase
VRDQILAPSFLEPLTDASVPVINLHPALPGKYDGINAIKRAWEDFQKWESEHTAGKEGQEIGRNAGKTRQDDLEHSRTGVMIHYVIAEVDAGEPIVVREVEFRSGETLDELEARMHEVEHEAIVKGTGLAIVRLWEERRKRESNS